MSQWVNHNGVHIFFLSFDDVGVRRILEMYLPLKGGFPSVLLYSAAQHRIAGRVVKGGNCRRQSQIKKMQGCTGFHVGQIITNLIYVLISIKYHMQYLDTALKSTRFLCLF